MKRTKLVTSTTLKISSVIVALSLSMTGAMAKAETDVKANSQCSRAFATDIANTKGRTRPNYDPDCGDYYEKCDAYGTCYECVSCTYGGPYCWEIN